MKFKEVTLPNKTKRNNYLNYYLKRLQRDWTTHKHKYHCFIVKMYTRWTKPVFSECLMQFAVKTSEINEFVNTPEIDDNNMSCLCRTSDMIFFHRNRLDIFVSSNIDSIYTISWRCIYVNRIHARKSLKYEFRRGVKLVHKHISVLFLQQYNLTLLVPLTLSTIINELCFRR